MAYLCEDMIDFVPQAVTTCISASTVCVLIFFLTVDLNRLYAYMQLKALYNDCFQLL